MEIQAQDDPKKQFNGPITALILLLKNVNLLPQYFADHNAVINDIKNILFTEDRQKQLAILATLRQSSPTLEDADLLANAFTVTETLTSAQQAVSTYYMNNFLRKDPDFLEELALFLEEAEEKNFICFKDFFDSIPDEIGLVAANEALPEQDLLHDQEPRRNPRALLFSTTPPAPPVTPATSPVSEEDDNFTRQASIFDMH